MMLEETLFMPERDLFQGREKLAGTATVTISKNSKNFSHITHLDFFPLAWMSSKKPTKSLFIATIHLKTIKI